jgi:hypothetical protein
MQKEEESLTLSEEQKRVSQKARICLAEALDLMERLDRLDSKSEYVPKFRSMTSSSPRPSTTGG